MIMPQIERLLKLDTCLVSDALDALGMKGAVAGLQPMCPGKPIAGRVLTVKLGPPIPNAPKVHLGAAAIDIAEPGDVIVVEHRGRTDVSGWGGLLSRAAIRAQVAGVIVDGACRDIDEYRALGFPVFARAAVPHTARGRVIEHSSGEPICVADVIVHPGDIVFADGSGVVFLTQEKAEDVIALAERLHAKELLMIKAIEAGEPIKQVLGANYEDMLKEGH
jgi:regulator of RNase E activity RraA